MVEAELQPIVGKFTVHAYAESLLPSDMGTLRLTGIFRASFFQVSQAKGSFNPCIKSMLKMKKRKN